MELITYLLLAVALARAARNRLPRFGTAMLVISGVAAELDFISYFFGPAAFLRFHRAVLHSLPGAVVMCSLIAAGFCFADRREKQKETESAAVKRLSFLSALTVCLVGAAAHVILDIASGIGVRLLWPFRGAWLSWDLLPDIDVWMLLLLAVGLLLPHLGRLVSDEIGEQKRGAPGRVAAVVTIALIVGYGGARAILHSRAIDLLVSRDYHGQPPQKAGAFPTGSNPFAWRGLVSTPGAIDEMNISLLPGANFDPERALSHYKPDDSPALTLAQETPDVRLFLSYARFPLATIEPRDRGSDVTFRDLRFPSGDASIDNITAAVELDSTVLGQSLRYPNASRR